MNSTVNLLLYIDPGTGSMLFTVLIGAVGALVYLVRSLFMRLKMAVGRDKSSQADKNKLPVVIFSDHKRYWNVFEPVLRELDARGQTAYFYTASSDDPALQADFRNIQCEFIGEGNRAYSRLNFLNAYVVLATTPNLEIFQWKRSRMADFYVHIVHMVNDATLYRMFGLDYYDGLLLSGPIQNDELHRLWEGRNIRPKEYRIIGNTYMDEMLKKVNSSSVQNKNANTTVLLAPTWGPSGIFSRYGSRIIEALLDTGYDIVIRPHPQSYTAEKNMIEELMAQYPDSDKITWNRDNDNFECLNKADILISDFSNVIFDFALVFDKPVIYTDTKIDLGIYDAYFLDENPWTLNILPEIGRELNEDTLPQIKALIDECLGSDTFAQGRDKARQDSWHHQGQSAALAAEYLIGKYRELKDKEEKV